MKLEASLKIADLYDNNLFSALAFLRQVLAGKFVYTNKVLLWMCFIPVYVAKEAQDNLRMVFKNDKSNKIDQLLY